MWANSGAAVQQRCMRGGHATCSVRALLGSCCLRVQVDHCLQRILDVLLRKTHLLHIPQRDQVGGKDDTVVHRCRQQWLQLIAGWGESGQLQGGAPWQVPFVV